MQRTLLNLRASVRSWGLQSSFPGLFLEPLRSISCCMGAQVGSPQPEVVGVTGGKTDGRERPEQSRA